MENIGVSQLVIKLLKLNPDANISYNDEIYPTVIITDVPAASIVLPEGYYLRGESEITNNGNTASGLYETFELLSQSDLDCR